MLMNTRLKPCPLTHFPTRSWLAFFAGTALAFLTTTVWLAAEVKRSPEASQREQLTIAPEEPTLLKFGEHGELGRILSSGGGESDEVTHTLERQRYRHG